MEAIKESGSSDQQFDLHARNFLDCVKSRQRPIADVEGGHQTTTACHLANLSLRLGRKLKWDPVKEEIAGDREAAAMLERPYSQTVGRCASRLVVMNRAPKSCSRRLFCNSKLTIDSTPFFEIATQAAANLWRQWMKRAVLAFLGSVALASTAQASTVFINGLAIPGATGDAFGTSLNNGRLGMFSDIY